MTTDRKSLVDELGEVWACDLLKADAIESSVEV